MAERIPLDEIFKNEIKIKNKKIKNFIYNKALPKTILMLMQFLDC